MTNRAIMYVAAAVAILAFVTASFAFSSEPEASICTADARLDAPEGWTWLRDGSNECAWTLYDDNGLNAPDSVYESVGEEPPPRQDPDWLGIVAFLIGVGASGISVVAFSKSREEMKRSGGA
jgi:hypothetical protein